jgi:hypothetical protein
MRDVSPFVKIDFPMVTGFMIDPMHTGIEGAFSRRFQCFILVPEEGKLSSSKIDEADRRIKFFIYVVLLDLTVMWANFQFVKIKKFT